MLVKIGDDTPQLQHHFGGGFTAFETCAEHHVLGQAYHQDEIFDGLEVKLIADAIASRAVRHDAEHLAVHVGGCALIEEQFLVTEETALPEGGEVEKAEVDGLFHLVCAGAGEEDDSGVGFTDFDGIRRRRRWGRRRAVRRASMTGRWAS